MISSSFTIKDHRFIQDQERNVEPRAEKLTQMIQMNVGLTRGRRIKHKASTELAEVGFRTSGRARSMLQNYKYGIS
jgi:hypothetical protein